MNKKSINIRIAVCLLVILFIVGVNVFAPFLTPYDPNELSMADKLQPPSAEHLLGTDNLGRDILSRAMYGGRASILIAVLATCCSMAMGMVLGILGGYFGGAVDAVITMISNIFQGLPGTTLMIAIVGILGPGTDSLILAMVVTSWVGFSRFVRGEIMRAKQEIYVEGTRILGAGNLYLIVRTILPNILGNCIILFSTKIGRVVLSVSGLSFLGLGIQPPTPDWGAMITDARKYFRAAPHLLFAPGICIIVFSLAINLLGDALRDRLDTKNDRMGEQ